MGLICCSYCDVVNHYYTGKKQMLSTFFLSLLLRLLLPLSLFFFFLLDLLQKKIKIAKHFFPLFEIILLTPILRSWENLPASPLFPSLDKHKSLHKVYSCLYAFNYIAKMLIHFSYRNKVCFHICLCFLNSVYYS